VQPSDAVASRNPSLDAVPKEPFLRWVASNIVRLTVYLALASFSIAVYAVLKEDGGPATLLGLSVLYFLYGAVFGIPGTIGWLLAVAFFPPEWSMRRRRAMAVAMSPLIQLIWLVELVTWGYGIAAAVVGLLLPAGSAFVVRFRERKPSSPWPPDGGEQSRHR